MRNAVGIFGGLAGAIVVALVARYGFATSDTRLDGAITAFFFAVIAIGGVGGPAVAVHLFRSSQGWGKAWGVIAGAIAVVALLANLSNSLGAIAGRADKTLAERKTATDARADARAALARLAREREVLPAFVPAAEDDVRAARAAVAAAERSTSAECGDGDPKRRGKYCRQREATEKAVREALAAVLERKGLTDRAARIAVSEAAERRKLEAAPRVSSVNPMADTLARIFHVQADDAATWQQIATVVVVELLIAFSLIAYELLGSGHATSAATPLAEAKREEAIPATADANASDPSPVESDASASDIASVGRFMLACLPRAEGERASWGEIYARYRAWCAEQEPAFAPLELVKFGEQFREVCARVGIRTRTVRKRAYCLDVRLAS